jgi:hypothetical protein
LRINFEYPVSTWVKLSRKGTMTSKLTDRFVTSRKPRVAGRAIYTDSTVPGLAFRVSAITARNPEGRRDWFLRYRPRRQEQKAVALGAYPAVSLSIARQRAGEIVAAAKRGVDLIAAEEGEFPVDELAELAETLMSIESLKERVTRPTESVSGPIDVAVISKADGFIWIRRKHYFEAELNPRFFGRKGYAREGQQG